jgi:hypothetical protein
MASILSKGRARPRRDHEHWAGPSGYGRRDPEWASLLNFSDLVGLDPTPAEFDECVERLIAMIGHGNGTNEAAMVALEGAEDPRAVDVYLSVAREFGRDPDRAQLVVRAISSLQVLLHAADLPSTQRRDVREELTVLATEGVGEVAGLSVRSYARDALHVPTD